MAQITATEADVLIPEIWDMEVLQARYAASVIMQRVLNKSALVKDKGDIIHIPIRPKLTAGTVSSVGAFTPVAATYTEIQVDERRKGLSSVYPASSISKRRLRQWYHRM